MKNVNINKDWFVYILHLRDDTYYTGITVNLEKRFKQHASGKGSKYVRSRLPFEVVFVDWAGHNRSSAQIHEHNVKKLSKTEKMELIQFYYKLIR
jgi:putative endonuclease